MDLKPSALFPSAHIPHRPYTDLREQLKTYGDAEVTVSLSSTTVAEEKSSEGSPIVLGDALAT